MWLSVIAYNLGNPWRRLGAAETDRHLVADESAAAVDEGGLSLISSLMLADKPMSTLSARYEKWALEKGAWTSASEAGDQRSLAFLRGGELARP